MLAKQIEETLKIWYQYFIDIVVLQLVLYFTQIALAAYTVDYRTHS